MSALQGKGFFIWQVKNAEGGVPAAIVAKARAAGLTHVLLKIADGKNAFGFDGRPLRDVVAPVVAALKAAGIEAWGWHYVYGNDPDGEASIALQRTKDLDLDGYVIDAETEYRSYAKADAATRFMTVLRRGLPYTPIALSSYRYPSYHQALPWAAFLEKCDFNMPQVYWEQAHNPAQQLRRSYTEFRDTSLVRFIRPFVPTGAAYGTGGWRAEPGDIIEFLQAARDLNLPAANLYSWDWATSSGNTDLWNAAAQFDWPVTPGTPLPPPVDATPIVEALRNGLNAHNVEDLVKLYHVTAAHVNPTRATAGHDGIRQWYARLFQNHLPNGAYNLYNTRTRDHVVTFNWNVNSSRGQFLDGADTLHLREGKIQYHYTNFRPLGK